MSNRGRRRSKPKNAHLHGLLANYLAMQKAITEVEFARLLAEHERYTDADGKPRLKLRTLREFRLGFGEGEDGQGFMGGLPKRTE